MNMTFKVLVFSHLMAQNLDGHRYFMKKLFLFPKEMNLLISWLMRGAAE